LRRIKRASCILQTQLDISPAAAHPATHYAIKK